MKAHTLLKGSNGVDKLGAGDLVMTMQCNRIEQGGGQYKLDVNMDWAFDDDTTPEEIKSMLGRFLGNVEEVFGEKMVTESITHWADENGKLIKLPGGKVAYLKSSGLDFKEGGE